MEQLTLLILGIISAILYYLIQKKFQDLDVFKLPQPPHLPLLGSALELSKDEVTVSRKLLIEWPKKYGPRSYFSITPRYNYFVSSKCSDIEKLLSSTTQLRKGMEYDFVNPWLGNGLLTTSEVSKWSKFRKSLSHSFNKNMVEQFMPVFIKHAKILVDILLCDSDSGKRDLDICHYSNLCALDIICETAMGRSIHAQREKDSPYVNAIYEITKLIIWRTSRPWLLPNLAWKLSPSGRREKLCLQKLHGYTDEVVRGRKAEVLKLREENKSLKMSNGSIDEDSVFFNRTKSLAFMDLLLNQQAENPENISDENIRAETDTFMFAGHDTTSANLAWTIYLLGLYPQKQERLFGDLIDALGKDLTNEVTSTDLIPLKYLDCCIKEALRMYPSVATITRELVEDLVLDGGLVIPRGFNFMIVPLAVHRDPVSFPEPDVYNPERFLPENSAGRHPYSFIPFSMGPRNCIGQKFALMEEKVILAYFLRKFRIESVTPEESIVLMHEIILRPKDGLIVKLHPRM